MKESLGLEEGDAVKLNPPNSGSEKLPPVVEAMPRQILCISVSPVVWARYQMCSRIYEVAVIIYGGYMSPGLLDTLMVSYAAAYAIMAWVLVPIYQNIKITKPKSSTEESTLGSVICNICQCKSGLTWRVDNETRSVTRYVPFSMYNYWYMIANPGKELNPVLDESGLDVFGGLRAYFLFQQCTSIGILKTLLFISAIWQLAVAESVGEYVVAIVTFIGALVNLQISFVSLGFFACAFPYIFATLVYPLTCVACPRLTNLLTNPPKGTMTYGVLHYFWNKCAWL
mmetsp:Transcript_23919/g.35113  ORF Transcript_23919/g.35113 Transcript_23919/m.35113 type:complete len:284 (+) Transcript_23919:44-895(+)|eukprot:CAMPEP_0185022040 /NCGR_PEP_ID=MMETSP1103-20130426/4765_1 /TAXON_ID=36769 /ORGANISM="Paraphysomonas bandaiensis, Strain Caron Lab Isolate" /LENGTH=283 /DNA_ID=CAMNT_0027553935 /DNA_START=25 /DNA_END=876 /DNA_ORIENTATION=+